jgi:hypothetical protein
MELCAFTSQRPDFKALGREVRPVRRKERMYFGQSDRSDSSDDSPLYPRNVTLKLRDIAPHTLKVERNENNQYVNSSSYHDLTTAIEKEKTKSILSRGNAITRRKPPPPPPTPPPQLEQEFHDFDVKKSLHRKSTVNIEPSQRRLLERVDYSPLTSPENIKFAR